MINKAGITEYFLFTQNSLAAFESCPLKFRKRYIENIKWRSFPDENIRKRVELGNDFHLLAYRYFMGIETGMEYADERSDALEKWFHNLKQAFIIEPHNLYIPEHKMRIAEGPLRLEANIDLLLVRGGKIEIWDWKTHVENSDTAKRRNAVRFRNSLQTKVYMFVMKEMAELVLGQEVECSNISMHYWQPDPPSIITDINYSDLMHEEYGEYLESKIQQILQYDYSKFDKSIFSKHCRFCEFNWLCNNERVDFKIMEEEEGFLDTLDRDNIK